MTDAQSLWKGILGKDVPALSGLSYEQLVNLSERELLRLDGITPARAKKVQAVCLLCKHLLTQPIEPDQPLKSSVDVFRAFHYKLCDDTREFFYVLLLDSKHKLKKECLVSIGSLTSALVHPREVFQPAIREAADSVICVHNHPSGDPQPSQEDRQITKRLIQAGELVGIQLLDHVIIGRNEYFSFADDGWRGC
jgi:DNA repair protein RadC